MQSHQHGHVEREAVLVEVDAVHVHHVDARASKRPINVRLVCRRYRVAHRGRNQPGRNSGGKQSTARCGALARHDDRRVTARGQFPLERGKDLLGPAHSARPNACEGVRNAQHGQTHAPPTPSAASPSCREASFASARKRPPFISQPKLS